MGLFRRKVDPQDLIEHDPANPAGMEANSVAEYLSRGLAYHARGDEQNAEADTRKAISMDPDSVDAFYNLGLILKAQERNPDARAAFEQALEKLAILQESDFERALMVEKLLRWQLRQVGG